MNTAQIAHRLVELCRQGKFDQAQEELFADNAVSLEPEGAPSGALGNAHGRAAMREKSKAFNQMVEAFHSVTVSDPLIAGNFFTLTMGLDVTYKQRGRLKMEEVGVYEVRDGKIVREQFFYPVG